MLLTPLGRSDVVSLTCHIPRPDSQTPTCKPSRISSASRAAFILADEPSGELDIATSRQIFSLFQMLVKREGITVLQSTHDPLVDEFTDIGFRLVDGILTPEYKNQEG